MKRNRKWMEDVIRNGGSVIHKGVHYLTIESLPSEAEIAKGDKEDEKAAEESILAEMSRLQEQLEILKPTSKKVEKEESKSEKSGEVAVKTK